MSFTVGGSTPQLTFADATVQNTAFTGLNQSATPFATSLGYQALNSNTGANNTAVGYQAGQSITSGSKNTILGGYSGNQGGLDIRTSNNNIVLSDGDGNPRAAFGLVGAANVWVFTSTDQTNRINAAETIQIIGNTSTGIDYSLFFSSQTGTTAYATRFYSRTSSAVVGGITFTSSATAYNTSSDYRLKENITPMTGALAKVAKLNPVTYTWKTDGSTGEGFIAHELAEVCPQAVNGAKDAVDAEGNPVYQGIDVSFLVGTLTAAIQELKAEFDAYKATHP